MENQENLPVHLKESALVSSGELTPEDVKAQIQLIQQVMQSAMIKDQHYGIIPGCGDKPALYKAGAEKLGLVFRLAPSYEIKKDSFESGSSTDKKWELRQTVNIQKYCRKRPFRR